MLPLAAAKSLVDRGFAIRAYTEQRAESAERVEAAVKAERKLVQKDLQMLEIDAPMVGPLQPSFQVAENQVDDRQIFSGHLQITAFNHRQVRIAALFQRRTGQSRLSPVGD